MKVRSRNVQSSIWALVLAQMLHAFPVSCCQERASQTGFDADFGQVVVFGRTASIEELGKLGAVLDEKWRSTDAKAHAVLMRALALGFRQYDLRVPANFSVARPVLNRTFESLDALPPEVAVQTLLLLEGTLGGAAKSQELQDWAHWRSNYVAAWLRTEMRALDSNDPTFTGEEVAALNVQPPLESGASAGADPRSIRDPKLRADYERAIEVNHKVGERVNQQHALKRDLPHFTNSVERVLVSAYARPPFAGSTAALTSLEADFSEFMGLVEEFMPDAYRRSRIYSKLEAALPMNAALSFRDQRQKHESDPEAKVSIGKRTNLRSKLEGQIAQGSSGRASGSATGSGKHGASGGGAQTGVAIPGTPKGIVWGLGALALGAIGFILLRAKSRRNP